MKRSDAFYLGAVVVAAPHLTPLAALLVAAVALVTFLVLNSRDL